MRLEMRYWSRAVQMCRWYASVIKFNVKGLLKSVSALNLVFGFSFEAELIQGLITAINYGLERDRNLQGMKFFYLSLFLVLLKLKLAFALPVLFFTGFLLYAGMVA